VDEKEQINIFNRWLGLVEWMMIAINPVVGVFLIVDNIHLGNEGMVG
jgi:hypothetical protein